MQLRNVVVVIIIRNIEIQQQLLHAFYPNNIQPFYKPGLKKIFLTITREYITLRNQP